MHVFGLSGMHFIAESSNCTTHYLAAVGLNNRTSMHCILQPFGRLQEKLDLDMGFGPPIPQLLVTPAPTDEHGFIRDFALA